MAKGVEGSEHIGRMSEKDWTDPEKRKGPWNEEEDRIRKEMADFPNQLRCKPYLRLKKAREHEFGSLRMWPKWKSLKVIWGKKEREPKKEWDEAVKEMGEVITATTNGEEKGCDGKEE